MINNCVSIKVIASETHPSCLLISHQQLISRWVGQLVLEVAGCDSASWINYPSPARSSSFRKDNEFEDILGLVSIKMLFDALKNLTVGPI